MSPCRVEMMRALARVAIETGKRGIAITQLRRVLAWMPDDKDARAQLAQLLAEAEKP